MELWLPYGETEIPVRIPDGNFYKIVEPGRPVPGDLAGLVKSAIENPVGDLSLKAILKPGGTAGIIVDPMVPLEARREAVSSLTAYLSSVGIENTRVFLRRRLSNTFQGQEGQKVLDPSQNSFTEIGKTTMGTSVDVDPEILSCEAKILIGMCSPHFATGFSGGPEGVVPAASSIRSITKNRALMMKGLHGPQSVADNPVLSDSMEACRLAGPFFSLCFLPDGWGGVRSIVAGELEAVFKESVLRFGEFHSPKLERKLDIVVVSAERTLGSDLYHAVRVVSNVLGALRKDGTVILVAECSNGIGDSTFLEYSRRFPNRKDLMTELRYRFRLGAHVNVYLQDIMEKCRIQLVSVLPELFVRDALNLKPSQTASDAVQKAIRVEGKESKILIVPKGEVTVPIMASN